MQITNSIMLNIISDFLKNNNVTHVTAGSHYVRDVTSFDSVRTKHSSFFDDLYPWI